MPAEPSKQKDVRYPHTREGEEIDEKLVTSWVKQAAKLPGYRSWQGS
jgi:hypothetical protein